MLHPVAPGVGWRRHMVRVCVSRSGNREHCEEEASKSNDRTSVAPFREAVPSSGPTTPLPFRMSAVGKTRTVRNRNPRRPGWPYFSCAVEEASRRWRSTGWWAGGWDVLEMRRISQVSARDQAPITPRDAWASAAGEPSARPRCRPRPAGVLSDRPARARSRSRAAGDSRGVR
ncbi:hypothetical protein VUR80DRAFT_9431 [Thermomyces stellatus]